MIDLKDLTKIYTEPMQKLQSLCVQEHGALLKKTPECSKINYGQPKNAKKGKHDDMAAKVGKPSLSIDSGLWKAILAIDTVINM